MKTLLQRPSALLFMIAFLYCMTADKAECADWLMILENKEGVFYADRDTALKNKTPVREARELSVLKNHKEIHRYLEVVEYDCNGKKRRVNQILTHTTDGKAVFQTNGNVPWETIASGQKAQVFFDAACRQ